MEGWNTRKRNMGEIMATKIEWAEETYNPITGCTPISEGCRNCYAKRMATRLRGRYGYPADDPFRVTWQGDRVIPGKGYTVLEQPFHWKKPRRVFVCSMGDIFHGCVNSIWIKNIFQEIKMHDLHKTGHIFMILTKRPQRLFADDFEDDADPPNSDYSFNVAPLYKHLPWPKNLWLGVTAENQEQYDTRWPIVASIPAAVHFVSCEPLLGYIDTTKHEKKPDWIPCGGETGPGARPMHPDWPRSLRDQAAGVPFFFKHWGSWVSFLQTNAMFDPTKTIRKWIDENGEEHNQDSDFNDGQSEPLYRVGKKAAGRLLDGREWNEYPVEP